MKSRLTRGAGARFFALLPAALLSLLVAGAAAQVPAPSPTALASDVKVAGQDVPVPARRKYVAPQYPAEAATQGIRGIVILEVTIGEDGKVLDTRVTRSIPGLDEAAQKAVMLWEYEVTRVAGKPVKVLLAQSITFALRLPDLQREVGIPELRSGGSPAPPAGLTAPESAAVEVTLGPQGEVAEASVLNGSPLVGEGLLRAVRSWRFTVSPRMATPSFTIEASWAPGPPLVLMLKAFNLKTGGKAAEAAPPAPPAGAPSAPPTAPSIGATAPAPPTPAAAAAASPPPPVETSDTPTPPVDTEVLPARPEPPAREAGASSVTDVVLGENIPDLIRGRRPVWPPLARLGNVTGEVVVRFSVDLAGKVTVHSADGPDLLKDAAEGAVGTWLFRRTAIDRLDLAATFKFGADRTMAQVVRAP